MDIFEQFIDTKIIEIPLSGFIFNLILAAILSSFLSLFYTRYGHSLSNRKLFARNFVFLSVITTLVITIIKSSLALSLGYEAFRRNGGEFGSVVSDKIRRF